MVRVKRRYIVLKLTRKKGEAAVNESELMNEIKEQVVQIYGDFGFGCLKRNFTLKRYDSTDGYAVIQIRKGVHEMIMSVLPLISKINDRSCTLTIIHLSGTMRQSLKELQQHYLMNLRATIGQQQLQHPQKQQRAQLQAVT